MEPKVRSSSLERIPLGRFGTPEEVAEAALFLVRNEYASNCIVNLDGGLSAAVSCFHLKPADQNANDFSLAMKPILTSMNRCRKMKRFLRNVEEGMRRARILSQVWLKAQGHLHQS